MGVASTTFMTMVGLSVNRDGVRIEAPHDLQEHDEHKIWTKKNTWHWETGWVWHLTQGQVLHVDANLVETHINMSPIQIHMGLMPLGLTVHAEASHFRKHINFHGGHHHDVMREFSQHAQVVSIETKKTRTTFGALADIGNDPLNAGEMALKAEGVMTLDSKTAITLSANLKGMLRFDNKGNAELAVTEEVNLISRKTVLKAGNSEVTLKTGEIKLESGAASISLSNGNLTTNGGDTKLNGKVTIGQPAITGMATKASVSALQNVSFRLDQESYRLKAEIEALKLRLP
jgi:hypothetical protein